MRKIIVEKTASKGIVMGNAFIVIHDKLRADKALIQESEKDSETAKFSTAVETAVKKISELAKNSDIFSAHLDVAKDKVLHESVINKIEDENKNAQLALEESISEICKMFDCIGDEYLRERSADVKDVGRQIMSVLKNINTNPFSEITENVIVVSDDLSPSDTMNMNFDNILGFITETGGITSHVSIIARSAGIPAITGETNITKKINNNDYLILDTIEGIIIINPDKKTIDEYNDKVKSIKENEQKNEKMKGLLAETTDGRYVKLFANIGSIYDIENAVKKGVNGVGLFRSEFIYMSKNYFPTEQEQFEVYKKSAESFCEGVIIRTLDIGGDKTLPYYKFDKEGNPFLGWRGIRISLELKDVFKTQLRAILRASAFGKVKIMYPMVVSKEEYIEANQILEECKCELRSQEIRFNENIQTGIMAETPSAVICADNLAEAVDFLSIGTNDLTQYILAVDRGNQKVSKIYNSFHPSVLKSIKMIIDAGHKYGKKVGMCGEFASDAQAVPLLLGMGLDEFSMASNNIAHIKHIIRSTSIKSACELAEKVCRENDIDNIIKLISHNV